jgi:outer membrane biosynthesis protein TonB
MKRRAWAMAVVVAATIASCGVDGESRTANDPRARSEPSGDTDDPEPPSKPAPHRAPASGTQIPSGPSPGWVPLSAVASVVPSASAASSVAATASMVVSASASASSGGDAEGADDVLKRLRGRTRTCYSRALQKDRDDPGGSVNLRVTIGPTGDVTKVVPSGTANKAIQNCVAGIIAGAHFKAPESRCEVTFGTAYMFQPAR